MTVSYMIMIAVYLFVREAADESGVIVEYICGEVGREDDDQGTHVQIPVRNLDANVILGHFVASALNVNDADAADPVEVEDDGVSMTTVDSVASVTTADELKLIGAAADDATLQ